MWKFDSYYTICVVKMSTTTTKKKKNPPESMAKMNSVFSVQYIFGFSSCPPQRTSIKALTGSVKAGEKFSPTARTKPSPPLT